jgi:hypothetical protein
MSQKRDTHCRHKAIKTDRLRDLAVNNQGLPELCPEHVW